MNIKYSEIKAINLSYLLSFFNLIYNLKKING